MRVLSRVFWGFRVLMGFKGVWGGVGLRFWVVGCLGWLGFKVLFGVWGIGILCAFPTPFRLSRVHGGTSRGHCSRPEAAKLHCTRNPKGGDPDGCGWGREPAAGQKQLVVDGVKPRIADPKP